LYRFEIKGGTLRYARGALGDVQLSLTGIPRIFQDFVLVFCDVARSDTIPWE